MSDANPTPGPWFADGMSVHSGLPADAGDMLADVSFARGVATCEANARLIAAAPDLLAACEFALRFVNAHDGSIGDLATTLRDAVSKARGR